MAQYVFINGCGSSGKDTFVNMCREFVAPDITVYNYSTITTAKILVGIIGRYIGGVEFNRQVDAKSDQYRSALSDVKQFLDIRYDASYVDFSQYVKLIDNTSFDREYCIFIHCREPEKIRDMISYLQGAGYSDYNKTNIHTLLITGRTTPDMYMNESDRSVYDFEYDHHIHNLSTTESLRRKAMRYMAGVLHYKITKSKTSE